jgi:predicted AlkP superfamily pyrophosphatase or phosphodiesterase
MRFGLLLAVGLTWLINGSDAAEPDSDRCVVLVSIDGLANFYLDDPRADLPTLRRLAKNGARAEGTICAFPTVTWPNHTTLVTGVAPARHGVIGNNYLDRKSGSPVPFIPDPLFDKDQIVKVPTVYDAADKAGLVTAGIVWPATRNARSLHWTVPDMGGTEAWLNMVRESGWKNFARKAFR